MQKKLAFNHDSYLLIALGACPPTTNMTLGRPIGVLGRVRGDWTRVLWSLVKRWYFIASMRKSLQAKLRLISGSDSTRSTRYSRDSNGSRTFSMSCARLSCRCSGSYFTHETTASNTCGNNTWKISHFTKLLCYTFFMGHSTDWSIVQRMSVGKILVTRARLHYSKA